MRTAEEIASEVVYTSGVRGPELCGIIRAAAHLAVTLTREQTVRGEVFNFDTLTDEEETP